MLDKKPIKQKLNEGIHHHLLQSPNVHLSTPYKSYLLHFLLNSTFYLLQTFSCHQLGRSNRWDHLSQTNPFKTCYLFQRLDASCSLSFQDYQPLLKLILIANQTTNPLSPQTSPIHHKLIMVHLLSKDFWNYFYRITNAMAQSHL